MPPTPSRAIGQKRRSYAHKSGQNMLLIIGKHAERLPNIHQIAAKTQMQLEVARSGAALKAAFAGSRRNIVVLDEQDLDDDFADALSDFVDEPHFKLLLLPRGRSASSASCVRLSEFDTVHWLENDVSDEELASAIKAYRSEMLKVRRQELQQAFVNREFIIQYQPKVAWIESENRWQTTEAEALIRWRHPRHGLLGPRHFLPEAEQAGYMEQISELVLRNVVRQVKRWDENGLSLIGCVNLCPSMLDLTSLANTYAQIALQYDLDCERITFEMPASRVLERPKERSSMLKKLRSAGFKISLDDFGASQNCMQAFEVLEFDEIKIHASVLKAGHNDAKTLHSLAALTGLAQNLGIAVCAEGVETEEMFEFLQEIHCNKMQGYLVSEAVMPDIIQSHYGGAEVDFDTAAGQTAIIHLM